MLWFGIFCRALIGSQILVFAYICTFDADLAADVRPDIRPTSPVTTRRLASTGVNINPCQYVKNSNFFSWLHTCLALIFLPVTSLLVTSLPAPVSAVALQALAILIRPFSGHTPPGHAPHWCHPLSQGRFAAVLAIPVPVALAPSVPFTHFLAPASPGPVFARPGLSVAATHLPEQPLPTTPHPAPVLDIAAGTWPSRSHPSWRRPGAAVIPPGHASTGQGPPSAHPGCSAARSQPSRSFPSLHRPGPSRLRPSRT